MKKTLISLVMVAGIVVSGAAIAGDIKPYARIHLSMDSWDDDQAGFNSSNVTDVALSTALGISLADAVVLEDILGAPSTGDDLDLASRKSVFGIKGNRDVGGGHKVFFKLEWEVVPDTSDGDGFKSGRDQYFGYKFGQGTVKVGTMSNNYKQMGSKMDKLWHTGLEGRGFLNMMSRAHGGKGVNGGRSTNTVQFASPKMGGMQMIINRTFSNDNASANIGGSTDEVTGIGFRIAKKKWMAFFDWIDMICDPVASSAGIATCVTNGTETGFKLGGQIKFGSFEVSAQVEDVSKIKTSGTIYSDTDFGEYTFVQAVYKMNKNNLIVASYGAEGDISTGAVLAYIHKTGGKSKIYVGWGGRSDDTDNGGAIETLNEQQIISVGWSASFK